jgi:hypothetical protein
MNGPADFGGTSRPSVMACTTTGTPAPAIIFAAASACVDMPVHTAVGHDGEQVRSAAAPLQGVDEAQDFGVLEEIPVLDGEVDLSQIHRDDAAGADIGVSDLGIPHLSIGETDVAAMGRERGVRTMGEDAVEIRGAGKERCIVGLGRADAPSVEDAENDRF